ncbi:zinc-binding alcohol dehydrogenase domain-containing protein 2 [Xylaria sp. CBS 124048]|nr:zinc-binding alcohol dehydrogenase domain-containing protein 2 [Xylaria sp. CBS 124048]
MIHDSRFTIHFTPTFTFIITITITFTFTITFTSTPRHNLHVSNTSHYPKSTSPLHTHNDVILPTTANNTFTDIKDGKGPATSLFINEATLKPILKPGEVLVRIKAFGLNRMDLLQREGRYPVPPHAPSTLGVEFSGTIAAIGPAPHHAISNAADAEPLREGDAVFGLAYGGAYAEYVAADPRTLLRKPAALSWEEAAGIPETYMTATQALHLVGDFRAGKSVLWHAGASGVSIAGIQLSRDAGASAVFATAGSDEKCRLLESELGVTRAFNYRTEDWAQGILEATNGAGVDLIVDFIGATYFEKNLAVAARDARWVMLGMMGGSKLEGVDIGMLLYKRIRIEGSTLRSRDVAYQGRLKEKLAEYIPHFESGKLKVRIDTVFPMADVAKAHELLEKNGTTGKIICTVP